MGDVGPYQDGYMEQEEEWEREGLLDPAWEKQQRKCPQLVCENTPVYKHRVGLRLSCSVRHGQKLDTLVIAWLSKSLASHAVGQVTDGWPRITFDGVRPSLPLSPALSTVTPKSALIQHHLDKEAVVDPAS
ncbi:hypothetical protein HPB47_000186 [Ixodes persulcatus]|uniref:Uncharacterized protein n=1 Tax=Ixodes persulcatus TaxID=34615 RepID=A0AC60PSN2_IXOPE|nr:hypothetical protein HPB47_000186 [Ixodes persulcatus]